MSTRALTLALRLLTAACAGAALGTLTGCPWIFACPEPWSEAEAVELGTDADILAIAPGGDYDELVAVGVGGVVVHVDSDGAVVSNPTNVTLRGVVSAGGVTVVVGDGGTILSSEDRGATWVAREAGTGDDLRAITFAALDTAPTLVAAAAEQLLFSTDSGASWTLVPAPAEGWGGLRAVFDRGDAVVAVAADGSVWTATDPAGAWLRETLDFAGAEPVGGGRVSGDQASAYASAAAIATREGLWLRPSDEQTWRPLTQTVDAEIVAYHGGFVVTANGTIYDVDENGYLTRIASVGLVPRAITSDWSGFVVAGEGGDAARAYFQDCIGGRPWTLDGELVTAKLVRGGAWANAAEHGGALALDPGTRELLAVAWGRDGQYEHASVASFARVTAELLALGAPAELVDASREAILDEIEHARRCFGLASRYSGSAVGPGPLPILAAREPAGDRRRTLDVEAFAVAVFEHGCINESVAAAEAAIAASECRDPWARGTLLDIAADERAHAALAWKTLRWLLDTHGYAVAPALRRCLTGLAGPLPRPEREPGWATEQQAALLRAHGRIPAEERAVIQRKVYAELILPLARELLGASERARA